MIKRAGDAGLKTLVFTVDVPEGSNRERNVRNGWGRPLKLTWKTKFEALRHPAWMMEWMKHGTPYFNNWAKYVEPGASAEKVADLVAYQNRAPMTWKQVERFRELWKGNFVLKGIMHPDDAIAPIRWASTASWCPTTARASSTTRRRRSRCCRRSTARSATR
jgi:L-lactate dehydrogenase (cytochrome)/(S)-mandelate dehydrogenase